MFATLIHLSRVGSHLNTFFNTTLYLLRPVDEQDINTFRERARVRTQHSRTYACARTAPMHKYNYKLINIILSHFTLTPPTFCHARTYPLSPMVFYVDLVPYLNKPPRHYIMKDCPICQFFPLYFKELSPTEILMT